jgi:hypothetical protein
LTDGQTNDTTLDAFGLKSAYCFGTRRFNVQAVQQHLERSWHTTVQTMLNILHRKGKGFAPEDRASSIPRSSVATVVGIT